MIGKPADFPCLSWYRRESESEVAQSCRTLCDPKDCSLPGSSVHAIFQAIVLEWIAISFSTGSSPPRDQTQVSCIVDRCFTIWGTREVWYRRRTLYIFQYTLWSFFGRQLCLLQIVSILCISFKHLYFSFFFITFVCILWWNKDLWDNSIVSVQNILRWTFIIWSMRFHHNKSCLLTMMKAQLLLSLKL